MIFAAHFTLVVKRILILISEVIVYGRHDLPSDARAFLFTSLGK